MQTRILLNRCGALCIGMLLMSAAVPSARGEGWFRRTSQSDNSNGSTPAPAPDQAQSQAQPGSTTWTECPPGYMVSGRTRFCRFCQGRGCPRCYVPVTGYYGAYGNGAYGAFGTYCDPRDRQLYAAQGYNVPVTVPLAPVCRIYNYGWGIPSARLSGATGYSAFYPNVAFTQTQGRLPGSLYPVVYQPTDTTQMGFYYQYVPTWVRR